MNGAGKAIAGMALWLLQRLTSAYRLPFIAPRPLPPAAFHLSPAHPRCQLPTLVVAKTFPIDASGGGGVWTADAVALPAATMLRLTSGRVDRPSGRFIRFTECIDSASFCFVLL